MADAIRPYKGQEMKIIHCFTIRKFEYTNRVDTLDGRYICHIDNDLSNMTVQRIIELLQKAYEEGIIKGTEQKAKEIRELLKI